MFNDTDDVQLVEFRGIVEKLATKNSRGHNYLAVSLMAALGGVLAQELVAAVGRVAKVSIEWEPEAEESSDAEKQQRLFDTEERMANDD